VVRFGLDKLKVIVLCTKKETRIKNIVFVCVGQKELVEPTDVWIRDAYLCLSKRFVSLMYVWTDNILASFFY